MLHASICALYTRCDFLNHNQTSAKFAMAYQSVCALHVVMVFFQTVPSSVTVLVIYAFTHLLVRRS